MCKSFQQRVLKDLIFKEWAHYFFIFVGPKGDYGVQGEKGKAKIIVEMRY